MLENMPKQNSLTTKANKMQLKKTLQRRRKVPYLKKGKDGNESSSTTTYKRHLHYNYDNTKKELHQVYMLYPQLQNIDQMHKQGSSGDRQKSAPPEDFPCSQPNYFVHSSKSFYILFDFVGYYRNARVQYAYNAEKPDGSYACYQKSYLIQILPPPISKRLFLTKENIKFQKQLWVNFFRLLFLYFTYYYENIFKNKQKVKSQLLYKKKENE
eukprot:TRINITY_DN4541_c3_g1_i10.p5 TRINITY_DN4541_c3_g1~~TRINITY_DN4541_c3_g1_i10.p5  ORF type:complete len:212 (-),score=5.12 TRINITY_DN4541_c3_g1_i10:686-1321(-)